MGFLTENGSIDEDINLFPVVIQYLNYENNSLEHKLVEIASVPNEKAITIKLLLTEVMKKVTVLIN